MDNIRVIYSKDLEDVDIESFMNSIKLKDDYLHKSLNKWILKDNSPGMRFDVLKCLADNVNQISHDSQFIFHLISLLGNVKIGPEYYIWIIDYFNNTAAIDILDFMIILTDSVEKNIPLSDLKKFFEEGKDDVITIYEKVVHFSTLIPGVNEEDNLESNSIISSSSAVSIEERDKDNDNDNMVSVFNDLLTVMTSGRKEEDSILPIQQTFTDLIAEIQLCVNKFTGFSTHVVHEWKTDKEEFIRLKALYNIQQRMLMSQQQKLYEARDEISRLKEKLRDVDKMKLHNKSINQKAEELQRLLSDEPDGLYLDD